MKRRSLSAADSAALDHQIARLPGRLYRYSGVDGERREWMRKLIVHSEVYFPSPKKFNDPIDCRVPLSFDASRLTIENYWRTHVKTEYPNDSMRGHRATIRRMVLRSKTAVGREVLAEEVYSRVAACGVACLAKSETNTLLWSHYADGHRGIAVSFKTDLDSFADCLRFIEPFKLYPAEVQYATERPCLSFYKSDDVERLTTLFGAKGPEWRYEEETRLVLVGECDRYVQLPPAMIDRVILGAKAESEAKEAIREWLAGRRPGIELWQARYASDSYDLEVVPAE